MSGDVRIGISGWRYEPWRGTFYPKDLKQDDELKFASSHFNSIEINGSFYSLQKPQYYQRWYEETPKDFVFAAKGARYITHMKRLRDVEAPVANFFASGILCLKEKIGPILWQFPPNFKCDVEKFESFFKLLPNDTKAAAKLASRHDEKVKDAWTKTDKNRPLRHAVEIRHESFRDEKFVRLLRKYGIAIVVADTAGKWPLMEDLTADFVYIRLHGDEEIYVSGYTPAAIRHWAGRVAAWREGKQPPDARCVLETSRKAKSRDVYVYFDNDVKVRAPRDAMMLAKILQAT
jgi:uncharacterized protein YecE (DUF72 family)